MLPPTTVAATSSGELAVDQFREAVGTIADHGHLAVLSAASLDEVSSGIYTRSSFVLEILPLSSIRANEWASAGTRKIAANTSSAHLSARCLSISYLLITLTHGPQLSNHEVRKLFDSSTEFDQTV